MAVYRGLFWTYERGTWQYDVMVALILAFIFFTPRSWFNDQPPVPRPSSVQLLSSSPTENVYQLPANLIDAASPQSIQNQAGRILEKATGKPVQVSRVEPAVNDDGYVIGYAVWIKAGKELEGF